MGSVIRKAAVGMPILVFLVLSALGLQRGRPGNWHHQCLQFWEQQKWDEIVNLAGNLLRVNEADPEVLYFSMLASRNLKDTAATQRFGELLLARRALNLRWESRFADLWLPDSLLQRMATYRARGVVLLLVLTALLCALAARTRRNGMLLASALASVAGCVFLLI